MKENPFQRVRETGDLIRRNWKALIIFELFYKLALAVVLIPILSLCFNGIMKLAGYAYMTLENQSLC